MNFAKTTPLWTQPSGPPLNLGLLSTRVEGYWTPPR